MPENKKEIVKAIIKSFLESIEAKKIQGIPLTQQETKWISQKNRLIDYVYAQKEPRVLPPDSRDFQNGNNDIDSRTLFISDSSIYIAITEMMRDGIIEFKDGHFQIKRTNSERYSLHPILKIAPHLPITHMPLDDIAVFRVPERYAAEVSHYLNSQFLENDIYTVAVSGLIICLDVKLPGNSEYICKKESVEKRVRKSLKDFKFNDHTGKIIAPCYTQQQVLEMRAVNDWEREKHLRSMEASSGGKITKRSARKIKRKKP